jgi:hypothetical protein
LILPFIRTTFYKVSGTEYVYDIIVSCVYCFTSFLLTGIHDQNEVLFYRFVSENLTKVLPVVYTPTEGEYIEKLSGRDLDGKEHTTDINMFHSTLIYSAVPGVSISTSLRRTIYRK